MVQPLNDGDPRDIPDLERWQRSILSLIEREDGEIIPIAQGVQRMFGFVPRNVLRFVARRIGTPLSRVYGVVTFYSSFFLEPRGKYIVQVCEGTACHVRGARRIADALSERFGVPLGGTTEDRQLTLETVACVGCCSLAPVIRINEDTHARLTPEQTAGLVAQVTGAGAGGES